MYLKNKDGILETWERHTSNGALLSHLTIRKKGLKQNGLLGITQFSGLVVMPPIALGVVYFIPSVSSS